MVQIPSFKVMLVKSALVPNRSRSVARVLAKVSMDGCDRAVSPACSASSD